jgi:hypothetical protein
MVMSKRTVSLALVLAAAGLSAACALESEEWEEVGSSEHDLYLSGNTWPNGVVPVCWSALSRERDDFTERARQVYDILNASWPAVADVEFTGWGACPANTNGRVEINLKTTQASATLGYRGNGESHYVDLGVDRGDFDGGLVPHEFGHTLGFHHEVKRPDFDDDDSGNCRGDDVSGDPVGTPPDRDSIMVSTGYCQQNPLLSRWDMVGARNVYGTRAENVIAAGFTLYARELSSGDIYHHTGSGWERIGFPGGQFVAVGSTLYGLAPSGRDIWRYAGSGTTWTLVGPTAARQILRCGGSLCATQPSTGDLYRYNGSGTSWTRIGGEATLYASTSTQTYRLTRARDAVERYSGTGTTWTRIAGPVGNLYATSTTLYGTDPDTGDLVRYNGSDWVRVGIPGRTFVAVGATLYGLSPNRSTVWRISSSGTYTPVGGAANWIYGGHSASLLATNPTTRDIWRYNGTNWLNLGQP